MKLEPFQQQIFDNLTKFKGRGVVQLTGRQTGKSQINQYINQWYDMQEQQQPKCKIISSAEVDGKAWHTISCRKEVSMWIRENSTENDSWYEHIDDKWTVHRNMFDVSEELYMMVVLKFGK